MTAEPAKPTPPTPAPAPGPRTPGAAGAPSARPAIIARGRRSAAPPPPPPPPPESWFSRRRISLYVEILALAAACYVGITTWYKLLGEWPTLGNLAPPKIQRFETVVDFEFAKGDRIFVAGAQDLSILHPENRIFPFVDATNDIPSPTVTALQAHSGAVWIATSKGVVYHDGKSIRELPSKEPLARQHATSLAVDASGRLWVGTAEEGLFRRDGKSFRQFKQQLPTPYVTAIAPAKGGKVWVSFFAGEIILTDGENWERVRTPDSLRGKAIRQMAPLGGDKVLALTDAGLFVVGKGGWEKAVLSGMPKKDRVIGVATSPDGRPYAWTGGGALMRISGLPRGTAAQIMSGSAVSALKWSGGVMYVAADGAILRVGARDNTPLTTWGRFMFPERFYPPVADIPLDWGDWQFKKNAGGLALSALLLGLALLARAFRWRYTGTDNGWRIQPLRTLGTGILLIALLFWTQQLGYLSTRAWMLLWRPALILFALWGFGHFVRVAKHEWALRRDAFRMGMGFTLATVGGWLWWGPGLLLPSLAVCAIGALFFGSSLQGIRQKRDHGFKLLWGIFLFAYELAAILPPLAFTAVVWGASGFRMTTTTPLTGQLTGLPQKFSWAPSGIQGAYVTAENVGWKVTMLDARSSAWKIREIEVPWGEVTATFPPDSGNMTLCYRKAGDTQVELYDLDGRQRWRVRIPGRPVPGRQPCWSAAEDRMFVVTISGDTSSVWRLGRAKGDAVKVATVSRRLSWPSVGRDGKYVYCAAGGIKEPGLAAISVAGGEVKWIRPEPYQAELPLVYDPSPEGLAVLDFLDKAKARLRAGLSTLQRGLQYAIRIFGWKAVLPEFWPSKPFPMPSRPHPVFRWSDYDSIRQASVSQNGKWIACVARLRAGGEQLLYMDSSGKEMRVLFATHGRIRDMAWTWYKNRMAIIEERESVFAPFPARRLLMVTDPPEETAVKPVMPMTKWISSPVFTPDGRKLVFAATDRFWRPKMGPEDRYGFYETEIETAVGVFVPPAETLAEKQEKTSGGGHGGGGSSAPAEKPSGGGGGHGGGGHH